jgi:phospholipase C
MCIQYAEGIHKLMASTKITRRELLKAGVATGATGLAASILSGCGGRAGMQTIPGTSSCAKVTDIDHVVILMQENRSFDHYFGS